MAARRSGAAGSVAGARALPAVLCLLGVLGPSSAVSAGRFPVFGPEVLRSKAGSTILAARPGPGYVLHVEAADPGAVPRFNVWLNGTAVVRWDELVETALPLERPVTLAARNSLKVEVLGEGGGAVRLSILGTDDQPPTISAVAAPRANAAGWQAAPVTIRFVCADDRSGVAVCPPPAAAGRE